MHSDTTTTLTQAIGAGIPQTATSMARHAVQTVGYDRTVGDNTWRTPVHVIKAVGRCDLDPCAATNARNEIAGKSFTEADDGLTKYWSQADLAFVNPPYGNDTAKWAAKTAAHGNALLLVFARTDTRWFHASVWEHPNTSAVLFLEGRLRFRRENGTVAGSAGAPSVLIAYGEEARFRLASAVARGTLCGHLVLLNNQPSLAQLALAA